MLLPLFIAQTPTPTPVSSPDPNLSIEGVLVTMLLITIPFLPGLFKSLIARINANTEEQLKKFDFIKVMTEEVEHLRTEREQDQKRISEAEKRADASEYRAEQMEKQQNEERQLRRDMQKQIDAMQAEIESLKRDNTAKDALISAKDQRLNEKDDRIKQLEELTLALKNELAQRGGSARPLSGNVSPFLDVKDGT